MAVYIDRMPRLLATALLFGLTPSLLPGVLIAASPGQDPAADQPMPDPITLMREVEAHQKEAERLIRDYTFHSLSVTDRLDGKGKIKKTETEERDFYVREGVPVSRLLKKDGKPLSENETKKEEERIRREVQHAKQKKREAADSGKAVTARGDDEISLSRILELGSFSHERRSMVAGRSAILLDYTGDKNAKSHNVTENIFKDLNGTITVDEATHALVHMDGQFANDFHVGGGLLASVSRGTHFSFTAKRINDEIWLPAEASGEGSARILLLAHLNGRLRVTFFDYRKFHATGTILPGVKTAPTEP